MSLQIFFLVYPLTLFVYVQKQNLIKHSSAPTLYYLATYCRYCGLFFNLYHILFNGYILFHDVQEVPLI